jgi:uncharacterized membrane protein SirB2
MVKYFRRMRTSQLLQFGASLAILVGVFAMDRQWLVAKICAVAAFFVLCSAGLILRAIEKDRDRSVDQ